ncbi:phage tail tape measure protein [Emticicia fontis]
MNDQNKNSVTDIAAIEQDASKKIQDGVDKVNKALEDFKKLLDSFSTAFISFGNEAVKYANELNGALGNVNNTFGESSEIVKNFAKYSLNSFGMAETSALKMVSSFGNMGLMMGLNQKEAANMGASLTALSADLASYKNVEVDVAGSALKDIFTGDADALKELGIAMTDANLQDFAEKSGFQETYAHMEEAEKAALRYGFVLNATAGAQGDFAKNGDDTASQMTIFTESVKELYASFGELLLPVLNSGLSILNDVIQFFKDLSPSVKTAILAVGGVAASISPLLAGFDKLKTLFEGTMAVFGKLGGVFQSVGSTIISALSATFSFIRTVVASLITTLGPIAVPLIAVGVAVAGVAIAVAYNWDKISKVLKETGIWETVTNIAKYALGLIVEIFDAFGNLLSGNWSGLWGNIKNIVAGGWNWIIDKMASGIKSVLKLQVKVSDALGLDGLSMLGKKGLASIDEFADGYKIKSEGLVKTGEKFAQKLSNLSFDFSFGGGKSDKKISGKDYGLDWQGKIDNNTDPKKGKPQEKPKPKPRYQPKVLTKALGDVDALQPKNSLLGMVIGNENEATSLQARVDALKSTFSDVFGGSKEEFVSIMSDAVNGYDFGANLQKKFDGIQIKMPTHILSNAEEINLEISNTFDRIREKFGEQSDATFSLLGEQMKQSIANGMKPEEAGQSIFESFQKIVEKIKAVFGENATMADFSAYGEQILQSVVNGLSLEKASGEVLDKIATMSKALTDAIQNSLKAAVSAVGDVISGLFEQAVGGKKLNVKAIAGGLLSTLGGIAMDLGKTALSVGLGIEAIKTSLKTLSGAGAIAAGIGLLALGGILKGVGGKLSGSASMGSTGGANGSASSPGFKYANAPSYAMQTQSSSQSSNESVLRGGDVFWSGQRYEVIRGF